MKKYLWFLLLILFLSTCEYCPAQSVLNGYKFRGGAAAPDECTGLLICQNFEGTGYDNGEAAKWANTGDGTWNVDYATTPAPLRGAQSAYEITAGDPHHATVTFTAADSIFGHFLIRRTTTPSDNSDWFNLLDVSDNGLANFFIRDSQRIDYTVEGGAGGYDSNPLPIGTTYHVWFRYKRGTGANAQFQIWIGTTTTRPASANYTGTDGTATGAPVKMELWVKNGLAYIIDQVLIKTSVFTTVSN